MTLVEDRTHKSLLHFLKKILDVPLGYSKEDLTMFRSIASKQYPSLLPLIEDYLQLAEHSETNVAIVSLRHNVKRSHRPSSEQMHLFDLLREKRLFASNTDLANFAGKVLPGIKGNRFDKMSRGDIAARIIEYLETKDSGTRRDLETSMREAMDSTSSGRSVDRKSFVSKWEKIIKGIRL
jgi:hypothetical protein